MPITPTYPGVYVEETPSGVRTITGVATSITAFIGRARRGPVNEPVTVNSFGDFERVFGGLWRDSPLSYAVRDFYLNGGSQALIVRLFHPFFGTDADRDQALDAAQDVSGAANTAAGAQGATATSVATAARTEADKPDNANEPRHTAADGVADAAEAAAAQSGATPTSVRDAAAAAVGQVAPLTRARLTVSNLNLEAANEGSWGNNLRTRVDQDIKPDSTTLFNLSVRELRDDGTTQTEVIRNVSFQPTDPRGVDRVLEQESQLVRLRGSLPSSRPAPSAAPAEGADPFSNASSSGVESAGRASDGAAPVLGDFQGTGMEANKRGLFALEKADLFNLLCIPPFSPATDVDKALWPVAAAYCERRRAMLLVDAPQKWTGAALARSGLATDIGLSHKNAAIFFPRLRQPDPERDNQPQNFAPCGVVAGVFARTDAQRGVWKAPAGLEGGLVGVPELSVPLTDPENGQLNPLGINCLRAMPAVGPVVWGARTLEGDDRLASEWKYIPVRRLTLYIEESLYRGTQWVVFEPNDEPLWAQIRLNVGAFMQNLFRQGAFQGTSPAEAYFVKCDKETTTQNDIDLGIVNILVGFAPLKPAEFVMIQIQQMAGQIAV
jgi:uncharacterized protein